MNPHFTDSLTLETATFTDDGLENKSTWSSGTTFRVPLMPASLRVQELARIRGEVVTHTAVVPKGVLTNGRTQRFTDGTNKFDVVEFVDLPRQTVAQLRKRT